MSDLIDRIADGSAVLLGIDEICKRLDISRTTFDRWVRNGGGKTGTVSLASLVGASVSGLDVSTMTSAADRLENIGQGAIKFPPPDIKIGNSPKWELRTFKNWLRENSTQTT